MSHTLATVLNNTGFTLIGVLLAFSYLQLNAWWHERRGEKHARPLTAIGFIGLFLILFAVISTIYFVRRDLQDSQRQKDEIAYRTCQANILQHNVEVQNDRSQKFKRSIEAQISYIKHFQRLVHEGQDPKANPKKILSSFDATANHTIAALYSTLRAQNNTPLKFVLSCRKPSGP